MLVAYFCYSEFVMVAVIVSKVFMSIFQGTSFKKEKVSLVCFHLPHLLATLQRCSTALIQLDSLSKYLTSGSKEIFDDNKHAQLLCSLRLKIQ